MQYITFTERKSINLFMMGNKAMSFRFDEDLIELAEECGSSEVYALLKRPDEKYLTERAYSHPMFVEDVARKAAQLAAAHPDITWFSVSVESFESIHAHSAFALVDSESMDEMA